MDNESQQATLNNILGMNLEINSKFFESIYFQDENVEKIFQTRRQLKKSNILEIILFLVILFMGYFLSFENLIYFINDRIIIILHAVFVSLFIIFAILTYKIKNKKIQDIFRNIQLLCFNIDLSFQAIIIALYCTDSEDESRKDSNNIYSEYIHKWQPSRLLILKNIITNFLLLILQYPNILKYLFYMTVYLLSNIICYFNSFYSNACSNKVYMNLRSANPNNINNSTNNDFNIYYQEIIGIFLFLIFYLLNRSWEIKLREVFAEKYKFEHLFFYTHDFIFGINSYQLNFQKNNLICYDKKLNKFLNDTLVKNNNADITEKNKLLEADVILEYNIDYLCNDHLMRKNTIILDKAQTCLPKYNISKSIKLFEGKKETNKMNKNNESYNFSLNEFNPLTYFLKELKKYEINDKSLNNPNKNLRKNSERLLEKIKKHTQARDIKRGKNENLNNDDINDLSKVECLNFNFKNFINNYVPEKGKGQPNISLFDKADNIKFLIKDEENKKKNSKNNNSEINLFEQLNLFLNDESIFKSEYENIYLGVFAFEPEHTKEDNFQSLRKKYKAEIQLKNELSKLNINKNFFVNNKDHVNLNIKTNTGSNANINNNNISINNNLNNSNCLNFSSLDLLRMNDINNKYSQNNNNKFSDNNYNCPSCTNENKIFCAKTHHKQSEMLKFLNDNFNNINNNIHSAKGHNGLHLDSFDKRKIIPLHSLNCKSNLHNKLCSKNCFCNDRDNYNIKNLNININSNYHNFCCYIDDRNCSDCCPINLFHNNNPNKIQHSFCKEKNSPSEIKKKVSNFVDIYDNENSIKHAFKILDEKKEDNKPHMLNKSHDSNNNNISNFVNNNHKDNYMTKSKVNNKSIPIVDNLTKNSNISNNDINHENYHINYQKQQTKENTNNMKKVNDNENCETVYFDVYFRRIHFSNDNVIYNIIFYDVTDLISAKLKIIEENKRKQKLFAKIAHEFKTPLTSIICLISIIKDSFDYSRSSSIDLSKKKWKNTTLTEDIKNTFDLIQNLSRYVIFLISDIINYSNKDKINEMKFEKSKVDFREISLFCYDILRSLLYCNISKLNKIKTDLIYDETIDTIIYYSDQTRIKQILLNFISNSVKFTNEGFIKLTFARSKDQKILNISVVDSGIGIEEKDQKLLFTDFSKNENLNVNNLNNANIGTGLGLSICNSIAEKLGMKIILSSDISKGTNITLQINLEQKDFVLTKDENSIYESIFTGNRRNNRNSANNSISLSRTNTMVGSNDNINLVSNILKEDLFPHGYSIKQTPLKNCEGPEKENILDNSNIKFNNIPFSNNRSHSGSLYTKKNASSKKEDDSIFSKPAHKQVCNQINLSYVDSYLEEMKLNNVENYRQRDKEYSYKKLETERFKCFSDNSTLMKSENKFPLTGTLNNNYVNFYFEYNLLR